jgi:hypothetical protein
LGGKQEWGNMLSVTRLLNGTATAADVLRYGRHTTSVPSLLLAVHPLHDPASRLPARQHVLQQQETVPNLRHSARFFGPKDGIGY